MVPGLFGGAPNPFAAFLNRPQQPPMQLPGVPRPGVPQMPQGMPMQMPYQVGNPMAMPFGPGGVSRWRNQMAPGGRDIKDMIRAASSNPNVDRRRIKAYNAGDAMKAFYGQSPHQQFLAGRIPGVPRNAELPAGFRNTWENPFFALQNGAGGGGGSNAPQNIDPKIPVGSAGGTFTPSPGSEVYRNPSRNDPRFIWTGTTYRKPSWEHGG